MLSASHKVSPSLFGGAVLLKPIIYSPTSNSRVRTHRGTYHNDALSKRGIAFEVLYYIYYTRTLKYRLQSGMFLGNLICSILSTPKMWLPDKRLQLPEVELFAGQVTIKPRAGIMAASVDRYITVTRHTSTWRHHTIVCHTW